MKKLITFIMILSCAIIGMSLVACTGDTPSTPSDTTPADTTPAPETTPAPDTTPSIDRGELVIRDAFAWVGYPDAKFFPAFSDEQYKEDLTYEYDTTGLTINAETCTITALKKGDYKVTAKSEHFSTVFNVKVQEINTTDAKFSAANYASAAADRKAQWAEKGNDGKTTLFIGDSFFDTGFWSSFYSAEYAGKDALCLGISATTTYDWEEWLDGWLGETAPKNIVMHVGTNNVYDDNEATLLALSAYQRLFTLMHEKFPTTHIYWFGVTQRSYDDVKIAYVNEINAGMKYWCDNLDFITYIDTPALITKDMLKDNVHPKLEYYKVFVDELAKTDIVIEDAPPAPVVPDATIADISFAKSQTIAAGTGLSTIKYKGFDLVNDYVVSGKLDIISVGTNPHVQFGLLDNSNNRILLWDNESVGKFKLCIPYDTNVPAEDIYTFTPGTTLTISWKIVCHEDYVYFYIDDQLQLVYTAINNYQYVPLRLGSEAVECKFYDIKALTLADDKAEYDKVIDGMKDTISKYSTHTSYEKIRVQ